jgi:hypothetical protein
MMNFAKENGRWLALASLLIVTAAFCTPSTAYAQHHHHGGGIGTGAAIGLGLGAAALGGALSAGAYGYPYGYGYAPAYNYPSPAYYQIPRSCWYPQYQGYYAC